MFFKCIVYLSEAKQPLINTKVYILRRSVKGIVTMARKEVQSFKEVYEDASEFDEEQEFDDEAFDGLESMSE